MKHLLFISVAIILLSACATILDGQTQKVTIRTPGVEKAKCTIYNPSFKYAVWNDQEIEIMKSNHDLAVNCKADANRQQTVHVKREVNDWVFVNVANGFVPGASYDYFSRGAFNYPSEIVVSFVGMHPKHYATPNYSKGINHPIENRGPSTILTEDYKYETPHKVEKLDNPYASDFENNQESSNSLSSGYSDLHRQYNPQVYSPTEEDK